MGKVTRGPVDQEETPRPQRKRRKDLDRIHSKILRAKRKLDNVGKSNNKAGQNKRGRAKICNRLLPEPAAGIYRNGTKGKDIQKAETLENKYHKARLKADALKLFNGDTQESKRAVEIPIHDKATEPSPNKDCVKNSLEWIVEQSPILAKSQNQNQNLYLAKKKEVTIFEDIDSNKIKKQNIKNKSRFVQKEDVCKRKLFQNDKEQLKTITPIPTQIFDNANLTKENKASDKEPEPMCSKNDKDSWCDPLSRYKEFCKIISNENFETDILQSYPLDPVTSTIKKLRHAYTDSFRQQLLRRKNKRELENAEPTYSVEHQACTSSQLSPVEFEVPKCNENHTIATRLQEGESQKDKFHLIQNAKLKKDDCIKRYSFISCSQNAFTYDKDGPVVKNCKNNDTQCSKQPKEVRFCQFSKSNFFVNEKDSIPLDSQKDLNYVNHLLKSKRHDKDNFSIDLDYKNSRRIDNSKLLGTSIFLSDPILSKRYFSKDYSREKLPIAVCDNCAPNNVPQKCNNKTASKFNAKNVKRVPTILRRCSNITINKPNHSSENNGDYAEGLYKKCEINLFSKSNDIEKKLYETAFPNSFKNLPTPSIVNAIVDQTNILEPQIGSMKIKDSQESQVEQFNINMYPKEYNERNEFRRYDDSLYLSRSFEASHNTNAYAEKLPQQEQISPDMRKHLFHSNNYRPINYFQGVSFSDSNVEHPTKQFPQQTKLHVCEANKQKLFQKNTRDQNQNILFNNINDETIPTPILNVSQNFRDEKGSELCRENLFNKTDVKCAKNQINQNACPCNEQYVYSDSGNCSRKYKEQARNFHKETVQPESLCDTRGYNNSIDNCANLFSTTRNVPLLTLQQKNNLYTYPKAIDDQHRAVLLQNVTQPVKYLAVENDSNIQRIPVYINDRSVRVAENAPLKVIALMNPSTQTKTFPQEISATQVVPLQTDNLHFNNFATRKISDPSFVRNLDSVNAILLNPDSQSSIWYASSL